MGQSPWSRSAERETSLLQKAQGVQGPSPGVPAALVFKAFASAKANKYFIIPIGEVLIGLRLRLYGFQVA